MSTVCSESHDKQYEATARSNDSWYTGLLTNIYTSDMSLRETWFDNRKAAVTFQAGEGCSLLPGTFGGQCEVGKTEACTMVPIQAACRGQGMKATS